VGGAEARMHELIVNRIFQVPLRLRLLDFLSHEERKELKAVLDQEFPASRGGER